MKKVLLILGAVAALVVGIVAVAAVGAQEGSPDAEKRGDEFIAKTAENLGITVEELTAAMTDARFEMIDEAVAEGKITEEQAAKLKDRIEEYGPLSHPHQGKGGHRACLGARFIVSAAATVLGMQEADLVERLKSGQSLAAVAESQGMGLEEFKAALLEQVKTQLQAKVDEGVLTQERADKIFAGIEENIDRIVNAVPEGDGPCQRPRHDGLVRMALLPSADRAGSRRSASLPPAARVDNQIAFFSEFERPAIGGPLPSFSGGRSV